MNVVDIILILPIIWAIYVGFRDGMVVQLTGIIGIFVGVWCAYEFGYVAVDLFNIRGDIAPAAGFGIVLATVLVVAWVLGKAIKSVVKAVGLGVLDKVGGMVLSLFKTFLILGIVVVVFEFCNNRFGWVKPKYTQESILYKPVAAFASVAFPYLDGVRTKYLKGDSGAKKNEKKNTNKEI